MLSPRQKITKRIFDLTIALIVVLLIWWFLLLLSIISAIDTKSSGFFCQKRVGQYGKLFWMFKIRTMRSNSNKSTITLHKDKRITVIGQFFRTFKLDELPQFLNVIIGQMSLVGPRPDVPGFADKLQGNDRVILSIKPGITGPASIFYKNEEILLKDKANAEQYNKDVIWPHKIKINLLYIEQYSFTKDLKYIFKTLFSYEK